MSTIFTTHFVEQEKKCMICDTELESLPNGIYLCKCGYTEDTY